jgi:hypothetical protein
MRTGGSLPTMSDPHASDAPVADGPHGLDDHGETHGHDDHGHDEEALGPIDAQAWGAGALGVALGLVIVWAFILANYAMPAT